MKNEILEHSFQHNDEEEIAVKEELLSPFDWIIISQENKLLSIWHIIDITCCFISPYFYAYLSAFQNPHVGEKLFIMLYTFEGIFLVSLLLNFLVEYQNLGDGKPVRDLQMIGKRYIDTDLKRDLIPLLPLQLIPLPGDYGRLFLFIKSMRLFKAIQHFKVRKLTSKIRHINEVRLQYNIANDPVFAEDSLSDHNKINFQLNVTNLLGILKLSTIILSITYFIGFLFLLFSKLYFVTQKNSHAKNITLTFFSIYWAYRVLASI